MTSDPDTSSTPTPPVPLDDARAPDAARIEAYAREVIAQFPYPNAQDAAEVTLRVEETADDETLDELQIDDPFELTGLYDGIPLSAKSAETPQHFPDRVILFRRAILDEWAARGDVGLAALVRNVVVNQFAHHFGWSDEEIAKIEKGDA